MLRTVNAPKAFEPLFEAAQDYVGRYFAEKREDPAQGTIEIFGERYILVRAASMSVEFFDTVARLYGQEGTAEATNIARQLLFDIAHAIGKQDARCFHEKMKLREPIERLSAGPVHFSHSGWAFVDIFPESTPSPDQDYYLIYDHPYSFESAAWIASGRRSDFPVCVMNAGYSSGWCEESFGVTLVSSEIMCQAKGESACRFIMAPPTRIEQHITAYLDQRPDLAPRITAYEVPGFFKRKEIEEQLRASEERLKSYAGRLEAMVEERTKDLRALQQRLIVQERLATLGQLAGGVGHELRNPLGAIKNAAFFLKMALEHPEPEVEETLQILDREVATAERIISSLLGYARPKVPKTRMVSLHELVRQALSRTAVPANVNVSTELDETPPLMIDPDQIVQVLINLMLNAVQAMPDGGRLRIASRAEAQDALVSVADTGSGIPRENLPRIFEPLFTTKTVGIGLGLAISKILVEANGGTISVQSEVGVGSTFVVRLPL